MCWFVCYAGWFRSCFIWISGNWLVCKTWWSPPSNSLISISKKISMILFSAVIPFLWLSLPSFFSTSSAEWVGCLEDKPGAMDSAHLVNSFYFPLAMVVFRVLVFRGGSFSRSETSIQIVFFLSTNTVPAFCCGCYSS